MDSAEFQPLHLVQRARFGRIMVSARQNFTSDGRAKALWALLVYLVVFYSATSPFLIGAAFPVYDADGFFAPFFMFVADLIRQGHLLTWNPYTNMGSPDFADPQVGAFCPILLSVAFITGSRVVGFCAYWLLIWSLAGLGIIALARRFSAPLSVGVACALAFSFSGFFVGHGEHTSFVRALAFLPLMIWRLEACLADKQVRPAAETGLFWGLSGIGAYPALWLLNGFTIAFWIAMRMLLPNEDGTQSGQDCRGRCLPTLSTVKWCVTAGLVVLVANVLVVLPSYTGLFVDAVGYTSRSGPLPRIIATDSNALAPAALGTFASPWLAVLPAAKLWAYTDISSCSIYLSGFVVLLALASLVYRPRCVQRWMLLAGVASALAAALGQALPFRGWLYDFIPPTRYFRHAAIFRGYAIFFCVVLALLGARDLWGERGPDPRALPRRSLRVIVFAGLSTLVVIFAWDRFKTISGIGGVAPTPLAVLQFSVVWVLAAGVLILVSLASRHEPIKQWAGLALFCVAATDAFICFVIGRPTLSHAPEVTGAQWGDLQNRRIETFDMLAAHGFARDVVSGPRVGLGPSLTSKNLLLRLPMFNGYSVLTNDVHLDWTKRSKLWWPLLQKQRMYFFEEASVASDDAAGRAAFVDRALRLSAPPLVLDPTAVEDSRLSIAEAPEGKVISIEPRSYRLDVLAFDVDAPADGWLLVTDRWARGWSATINGNVVPIFKANFILRGLKVQRGINRVVFRFSVAGFPWLPALSWLTAAGIVLWAVLTKVRGRVSRPL